LALHGTVGIVLADFRKKPSRRIAERRTIQCCKSYRNFYLPVNFMSISSETPLKSRTKLTYNEYVLFPDDGNRHEIIDGRHYMNSAPVPRHQAVSRHIQFQLYQQIELPQLGQVINAPIDLQLSEVDVVQPDLVVVLVENRIITQTRIRGVPDLVIEILSPSNRKHDTELKKQLYEQFAVPEYWIVDPDECVVSRYRLDDTGKFSVAAEFKQVITFEGIPGAAAVDLTRVW
jgi:Uma2 family endonuclease